MQRREGSFTGSGGLTIYYQYWQPEGDVRAVLLLAHGAAEHGGRYERLAEFLTARGIVVAALDHAGHGRSEGEPGFVNRFDDYVRDLGAFQQEMQGVAAGTPRFLLGHSMGGLVSVNYLLEHQQQLAGCALSGPALATDLQPGLLQLFTIRLLSLIAPRFGALQLDADGVSRDPAEVTKYRSDPLVYTGKLSARLVAELFVAMKSAEEGAPDINIPLLIMHGSDDQMTAPSGSEALHERAGSTDKTLKIYSGLYHEIFNEPERMEVMAALADWLEKHLD